MIRAADGLDYDSITAKIKNQPADTTRNKAIQRLREQGRSEEFIATFIHGWDVFDPLQQAEDGSASGFLAAYEAWKQEDDRLQAQRSAVWKEIIGQAAFTAFTQAKSPEFDRFRASGSPENGPGSV